jgi:hypothetical protein
VTAVGEIGRLQSGSIPFAQRPGGRVHGWRPQYDSGFDGDTVPALCGIASLSLIADLLLVFHPPRSNVERVWLVLVATDCDWPQEVC